MSALKNNCVQEHRYGINQEVAVLYKGGNLENLLGATRKCDNNNWRISLVLQGEKVYACSLNDDGDGYKFVQYVTKLPDGMMVKIPPQYKDGKSAYGLSYSVHNMWLLLSDSMHDGSPAGIRVDYDDNDLHIRIYGTDGYNPTCIGNNEFYEYDQKSFVSYLLDEVKSEDQEIEIPAMIMTKYPTLNKKQAPQRKVMEVHMPNFYE